MTHLLRTTSALLLLGLLAVPAHALPGLPVAAPPLPPMQGSLQTPMGGATAGVDGHAIDACADAAPAVPALPVPALPQAPLPVPVPVPAVPAVPSLPDLPTAHACAHADLDGPGASLDANAGPAGVAVQDGQLDAHAGPVKAHAETPIEAFLAWLGNLF